jgi:carbon storage regulator
MLVLTRKVGEQVVVPQCQLTVTILDTTSGRVRLGITAPPDVVVHRAEVCQRIRTKQAVAIGGAMMSVRILIADRDEFLSATYRERLVSHGAVVVTATTGLACIDRLRDFAPDVLVLDPAILWGGGDGVLAVMHEDSRIRPASVLLLTRGEDRSLLYRLSPFKLDDFQTKPLAPDRLVERIAALVTSHNTLPRQDELTSTSPSSRLQQHDETERYLVASPGSS